MISKERDKELPPKLKGMEGINPLDSSIQRELNARAITVVFKALHTAFKTADVNLMAKAVKCYKDFRDCLKDDSLYLLENIKTMSDKQLMLLEAELSHRRDLLDFSRGKLGVGEVFELSQPNAKNGPNKSKRAKRATKARKKNNVVK